MIDRIDAACDLPFECDIGSLNETIWLELLPRKGHNILYVSERPIETYFLLADTDMRLPISPIIGNNRLTADKAIIADMPSVSR